MKFSFLFSVLCFTGSNPMESIHSFPLAKQNPSIERHPFYMISPPPSPPPPSPTPPSLEKKIQAYSTLVRSNHIVPTFFLSFSGAWILNPSFSTLFQNKYFWISTIQTILILMSSMMINDVFDIETDQYNHPERALITGDISIEEAVSTIIGMSTIVEIMNILFMTPSLRFITRLSLFLVTIYTPILKKIPVIKNVFCASLVSFAPFFAGLAMMTKTREWISVQPNFDLFAISIQILFLGSWANEILLDIRDMEGDKRARIYTFPVLFGKTAAWYMAMSILTFNAFSSTVSVAYRLQGHPVSMILPLLFGGLFASFLKIPRNKFSRTAILETTEKTNRVFFFILFLFCGLSWVRVFVR